MKVKKCILYQWNVNIIQIPILSLFTFTWWGWTLSPFYVRSHADRWKKQWKRLRAHAFPLTDLDANIVTGGCRARRPFTPVGPVRVDLRNKTNKTLAHSYVKMHMPPYGIHFCTLMDCLLTNCTWWTLESHMVVGTAVTKWLLLIDTPEALLQTGMDHLPRIRSCNPVRGTGLDGYRSWADPFSVVEADGF